MIATLTPEGRVTAALRSPRRLLVLYDAECSLCVRCRQWVEHEPAHVEVTFCDAGSGPAMEAFAPLRPWLRRELIVIGDRGEAWIGPAAFLICLWATKRYRTWSYRLSGPAFAPLAERFFHLVSSQRKTIGRALGTPAPCDDGRCRHGQ